MARHKRNQVQHPPQKAAQRPPSEKFVATFNKAIAAHQQGRLDDAIAAFREAIALNPTEAITYNNLGAVLKTQGKAAEAVEVLQKAIALDPKGAMAYSNLGSALTAARRYDDAVVALRQALILQPEYPEAKNNLCSALMELSQLDEAESLVRRALALKPDYPEAHSNLGAVLSAAGRTAEAIAAFEACIALAPTIPMPHKNLGLAQLRNGDYAVGWQNYEWRWKADGIPPRAYPKPLWQGGPVKGKTILLYAEQGLGDAIQFARFVPVLVAMGARVVLEVHEPLIPLMRSLPGVSDVIPLGGELPHFDMFQAIMTVPSLLSVRPDNVPCPVPYLRAEQARVSTWRERLGTQGFKVGIVWEGKGETPSQRSRSAPLEKFAALAAIPNVRLISLQKGGDVSGVSFPVESLGPDFDSSGGAFLDSAAVMMNMDLVVSIDTSMVHLSGALDVPTWIPLKHAPDWRFGDKGSEWNWYPNARLYRQPAVGQWDEPFARIAADLRTVVANGSVPKVAPKQVVLTPVAAPTAAPGTAPTSAPSKSFGRDYSRLDRFLDGLATDVYPEMPSEIHDQIIKNTIASLHKDGILKPGQHVLDVGCGQGLALEELGKIGMKATGVTLGSDAGVCRAKGLDVREMDQSFMDFADASFDVLWCRHVLEHSIMPMFTLSEYKRLCKPGGHIYVEVPGADTPIHHEAGENHYSIFPMSSWAALFAKNGLAIEKTWIVGFTALAGEDKYWSFLLRRPA